MEATSPTLLMRLKANGPEREVAWSDFRRHYAPIVAGFARNLGVPAQEVDDLIQEVLTGFYAAMPRFTYDPERGRFRGYLKTCVVHLLSKRAAERKLVLDGRPVEQVDPADERIGKAWDESWEREQLLRAVEEVRRHYDDNATFNAFYRVAILGHEVADVAREMKMSVDSVYQAKTRCTARLRSTLKQFEDEEG